MRLSQRTLNLAPMTPSLSPLCCMDWGHRGEFWRPVRGHRGHSPDLWERFGKGVVSMPWRELTVTDQREEFVKLALTPGANMSELCRRFGIVPSNGHKWLSRYLAEGRDGLADRSRRPHCSPT